MVIPVDCTLYTATILKASGNHNLTTLVLYVDTALFEIIRVHHVLKNSASMFYK